MLFIVQNFTQGDLHSTGGIQMSFLGGYNSTGGIQLSLIGVYNSRKDIWIPQVECKSPCVKFLIVKSIFWNPSSENKIPPVVSSRIEILLRTSLSLFLNIKEIWKTRNIIYLITFHEVIWIIKASLSWFGQTNFPTDRWFFSK